MENLHNLEYKIIINEYYQPINNFKSENIFYELTNEQYIDNNNIIIILKKDTNIFITNNDEVKNILNIPNIIKPLNDFTIFIKCNDSNLMINPNTKILIIENKKIEIVFSFDTTGSMYPCLTEVRKKLKETIIKLKNDIPGIRIAIIAHGDYCDENIYVTKIMNFTCDIDKLCTFIQSVPPTSGGDCDECYELVLHQVHTELNWSSDSIKSLVIIGDANPHSIDYPFNKKKLDWKKEAEILKSKKIKIYAVQALNREVNFYKNLAEISDGYHLVLDQFSSIIFFIMAICYNEQGSENLENFQNEYTKTQNMNREMHRLFNKLTNKTTEFISETTGSHCSDERVPVKPSRFQILTVDSIKCSIKDFVLKNGLIFKTGRGFYEFTKPEIISDKKEIVIVDKNTGDMFTGKEAFKLINYTNGIKLKPVNLEKYRVFIQSTSTTRQLIHNTGFLYEVDEDH